MCVCLSVNVFVWVFLCVRMWVCVPVCMCECVSDCVFGCVCRVCVYVRVWELVPWFVCLYFVCVAMSL